MQIVLKKEIDDREKRIERNRKRLKVALDKLLDGILTDDEYRETRKECDRIIRYYEKEILALRERLSAPEAVLENTWVKLLLSKGRLTELDRDIVVRLIDKIYVYEDKHIEIVYKFSDEFDHLFINEIQST